MLRSLIYASVTALLAKTASAAATCPILSGVCDGEIESYEFLPAGSTPDNPNCDSFVCHLACEVACQPITSCPSGSKLGKMLKHKDRCGCDHCLNDAGDRMDLPYCVRNPETCQKASEVDCGEGMLVELYHPKGEYGALPCCPEFHCVKKSSCYHACGHEEIGMDCHCDFDCAKRDDCCSDIIYTCPALVDKMKRDGLWKDPTTPAPILQVATEDVGTMVAQGGGGGGGGGANWNNYNNNALYGYPIPLQCSGYCGTSAPSGCWCDAQCVETKDCCPDYETVCKYYAQMNQKIPRPEEIAPAFEYNNYNPKPKPLPIGKTPAAAGLSAYQVFGTNFNQIKFKGCSGGVCGMSATDFNGQLCFCDNDCHTNNDCCSNKETFCGSDPSDQGQQDQHYYQVPMYQVANSQVVQVQPQVDNNAFEAMDIVANGYSLMCKHNCGRQGWHNGAKCYCDPMCVIKKDCCPDYQTSC